MCHKHGNDRAVPVSLALRLSFLFAKHTSAQILSLARGQVGQVVEGLEGWQTECETPETWTRLTANMFKSHSV